MSSMRIALFTLSALAALFVGGVVPTVSQAQLTPIEVERPDARISGDITFFSGNRTVNGFDASIFGASITATGEVRLLDDVWLMLQWGFPHGSFTTQLDPADPTTRFGGNGTELGNPYAGVAWDGIADLFHLHAELGLTAPLATRPALDLMSFASIAKRYAGEVVTAAEGNSRPWLYLPNTFSVVARGRAETRGALFAAAELVVAPLISTDSVDGVFDGSSEIVLVPAAEIGYRASGEIYTALRAQLAWFPTQASQTQVSIEPYVRVEKRGVGLIRVGLLMNLDEPNGFAFDREGVWGVRLNLGVVL